MFIGIKLIGYLLVIIAYGIIFIVMKENAYASKTIRVEENQIVIMTGPYTYVRHPMYLGFLFICLGFPLAFGSFFSLPFGIFSIFLMAIRSIYEEKTLIRDLKGYSDYIKKVPYRFIPKLW